MNGTSPDSLAAAIIAGLDEAALDALAERLAPRVEERLGGSGEPEQSPDGWATTAEAAIGRRLLTISDLADFAHVHRKTIERHIRAGRLEAVEVGSGAGSAIRVRPEAVEAWLKGCQVVPKAPQKTAARPSQLAPDRGKLQVVDGMGR